MTEHPDCALVRQGYDAFSRGDMEALSQLMTSDVTHHVPGEHPLAGHHKGREAVLRLYGRLAEETQGTMRVDLEGAFADGRGHVMSVHRIRADRGNMGLEQHGGIFFTVIGGKISDLDECVQDIDETNRFWS
ncbi:nuclear transport factor 2 family protein [Streptomyces meridianus]|uniref:Nuclear transport factor 2 family protein n=1 Tax=Streptomyces meridianus TaxID=2938945 RepID=A0ABT0XCP7_9ACTN|nr:nuclear transport factor 2 family protein [Streptomyces meridianus]MCM2580297.1 nuclear transport factor 2 family protein [Streptomyces meridianus]